MIFGQNFKFPLSSCMVKLKGYKWVISQFILNFFILYIKLIYSLLFSKSPIFALSAKISTYLDWQLSIKSAGRHIQEQQSKWTLKFYLINQATFLPSFIIFALKKTNYSFLKVADICKLTICPPKTRNCKILW